MHHRYSAKFLKEHSAKTIWNENNITTTAIQKQKLLEHQNRQRQKEQVEQMQHLLLQSLMPQNQQQIQQQNQQQQQQQQQQQLQLQNQQRQQQEQQQILQNQQQQQRLQKHLQHQQRQQEQQQQQHLQHQQQKKRVKYTSSAVRQKQQKQHQQQQQKNNEALHQVFFHLSGKNFKVPGNFSYEDKRTIQEWARIWKRSRIDSNHSQMPSTTNDPRTVKLHSKSHPPQIWNMKKLFDWFHLKIESLPVNYDHRQMQPVDQRQNVPIHIGQSNIQQPVVFKQVAPVPKFVRKNQVYVRRPTKKRKKSINYFGSCLSSFNVLRSNPNHLKNLVQNNIRNNIREL